MIKRLSCCLLLFCVCLLSFFPTSSGWRFGFQNGFGTRTRRQIGNSVAFGVSPEEGGRVNTCRQEQGQVVGAWSCENGDVIHCALLCNGARDCVDGSDEQAVSCRHTFCLKETFRCSYGGCIRAEQECDGVEDCADGSDERTLNCPGILNQIRGNCSEGFFQCKSGECVYDDLVCNGTPNCKDTSDETEEECSAHFCPELSFQCDYGACILLSARCDGKQDCADNSDEKPQLCPASSTTEKPTTTPSHVMILEVTDPPPRKEPTGGSGEAGAAYYVPQEPASAAVSETFYERVKSLLYAQETEISNLRKTLLDIKLNFWRSGGDVDDPLTKQERKSYPDGPNKTIKKTNLPVSDDYFLETGQLSTTEYDTGFLGCKVPVLEGGRVTDETGVTIEKPMVKDLEWVYFECTPRENFRGTENSTYCVSGEYLGVIPTCAKSCSGVQLNTLSVQAECFQPDGTKISCSQQVPPKTIAILSCKVGYRRPDRTLPDAFVCSDDGNWNAHVYKCIPICGEVTEGRRLIVGGQDSNITQVPWHAGIYENVGRRMEQICGGSIINPTAIVTAAHCFWDQQRKAMKEAELYGVAVGKTLRDFDADEPTSQKYKVASIKIYDQYMDYEGLFVSDIAVVLLDKPIIFQSYIKPICVEYSLKGNQRYVVSGITGRVAGWGLTASAGEPSPVLKTIDLPTVDFNTCLNESPPSFKPFITTDKFCGGFTSGESVCRGDSGGGLAFPKPSEDKATTVYFLRGIVSVGPILQGSCDNTKYSAFTDIQLHNLFLYDYLFV